MYRSMNHNIKKLICTTMTAAVMCTCAVLPSTAKLPATNISIINTLEASAANETYTFYVANTNVNERSGPGTNYKKVGLVCGGDRVIVYQISGKWGRLSPSGSKSQVWVCMDYFTKTTCPAQVCTKSGVNVRKSPSINGKKDGALSNGTKVKIYKVSIDSAGRFWGAINSSCSRWVCCVDSDGTEYVPCTG